MVIFCKHTFPLTKYSCFYDIKLVTVEIYQIQLKYLGKIKANSNEYNIKLLYFQDHLNMYILKQFKTNV